MIAESERHFFAAFRTIFQRNLPKVQMVEVVPFFHMHQLKQQQNFVYCLCSSCKFRNFTLTSCRGSRKIF